MDGVVPVANVVMRVSQSTLARGLEHECGEKFPHTLDDRSVGM